MITTKDDYTFVKEINNPNKNDVKDLRSGKVTILIINDANKNTIKMFGKLATQNQHGIGRDFNIEGDTFFRVGSDDKNVPHVHLNENMPWHHDRGYTDPFPFVGLLCLEFEEGSPPTQFADMRKAYIDSSAELKEKTQDLVCVNSFKKYKSKAKYPVPFLSKAWERVYSMKAWKKHPLVMKDDYGKWFYFSESATECEFEDEMMEACFNNINIYNHYYKPNQLLVYNNLTTCHRRNSCSDTLRRRHIRYALT